MCIAIALIISVAGWIGTSTFSDLVGLIAIICASWAACQSINSERISQRAVALRSLLEKPFRDDTKAHLDDIKTAKSGWFVSLLTLNVAATLGILIVGGPTETSSVQHGAAVMFSLGFVCYFAATRLSETGLVSAGLGRWYPVGVAGGLSTVLLIVMWSTQLNRLEHDWEAIAFLAVLLIQVATAWLVAIGAVGVGPLKAVARRSTGVPGHLHPSDGNARGYGHWIAVAVTSVAIPSMFGLAQTGMNEGLKVLVIGGLLFCIVSHLMASTIFSRGPLRGLAVHPG